MDVVMPGLNGFQATRKISKNAGTADIPIIFVTTKNQETDRIWGLRQGASAYLTKPVDKNAARQRHQRRARRLRSDDDRKRGCPFPQAQLTVMSENGPTPIDAAELMSEGLSVLFAVPGAFTPTCSAKHLPGFIEQAEALRAAGVDRIVCMSVNDVFVMDAWGKSAGLDGNEPAVVMAADGNGDFTQALGLEMDGRAFGMGMRAQRFALIVRDGVVEDVLIEAPGEFRVSSADYVLSRLA
jgi:peroxiredoxin